MTNYTSAYTGSQIDARLNNARTPTSHSNSHTARYSGSDPVYLDDLAVGDTLFNNVAITAHGLCPKLPNNINKFLNGQGGWSTSTVLNVKEYGAIGNGTSNDTVAIQTALNAALPGQVVFLPPDGRYLIDSANLNIPRGVQVQSTWNAPGSTWGPGAVIDLSDYNGALIINPAYTITMQAGSNLTGIPIYRKGLVIPVSNASAFTGTAITIQGDDVGVSYCLIIGFNTGITSDGSGRQKLETIYGDNLSGIYLYHCYDSPIIRNCHMWPFTSNATGADPTAHHRSGVAYHIQSSSILCLAHCFSYGYAVGFKINAVDNPVLIECIADSTSQYTDTTGFWFTGGTGHCSAIGCTSYGVDQHYMVDTTPNTVIEFVDCNAHGQATGGNQSVGFYIIEGDVSVLGGSITDVDKAVYIDSNNTVLIIRDTRFLRIAVHIIYNAGSSPWLYLSPDTSQLPIGTSIIQGTQTMQSVASATNLALPVMGENFRVSGTTGFGYISAGWVNRQVTLLFGAVLTVYHSIGSNGIRLNGSTNFITSAGSVLTLFHDGIQWYEISRSI